MKFGVQKLETWLYRTALNLLRYRQPRRRGSRVWQTDRQRDKQTKRPL